MLLGLSNSFLYAEGAYVTWKPPIAIPISFTISNNGLSVGVSKQVVTPYGVFELGYEAYELKRRSDYQPNYTYVVIRSKTTEKEYVFKVNDGKELKLKNKGECEVLIRKNRVIITIGKGSSFKVDFDVVDGHTTSTSKSTSKKSTHKLLEPSKSTCERYGGEIDKDGCIATLSKANNICSAMGARLVTVNVNILGKINFTPPLPIQVIKSIHDEFVGDYVRCVK